MSFLDDRREQLAQLAELIRQAEGDPALELVREGLLRHQEMLLAEVEAEGQSTVSLRLSGPQTGDGSIRADFLAKVLTGLQSSISSVGQALEGTPTLRAALPAEIVSQTQLRVVGTFPGSFGLFLEGPPVVETPLFIEPDLPHERLFDRALGTILEIMGSVSELQDNPDAALDRLVDIGPRSVGHLKSLAGAIASGEAVTTFSWRPPVRDALSVRFTALEARQLERVLSSAELTEREETVRGTLVGANLVRDTFELATEDEKTIRGRVLPGLREDVAGAFSRLCDVTLTVSVATSEVTGRVVEKYLLVGVERV